MTGRPPHQPTDDTRFIVSTACVAGVTHERIAQMIGVSLKTLLKHYQDELQGGDAMLTTRVAGNLYQHAAGFRGDPKAQVTAAIFWMKTRAGWRENVDVNLTGKMELELQASADAFDTRMAAIAARVSAGRDPGGTDAG